MSPEDKVTSLSDALRQRILAGEFGTGGRLPSLRMFAQQYGTTQETINKVIQRLQAEGLLKSLGRAGVFVRIPRTRIPGIVPRFDLYLKELGLEPVEKNIGEPGIVTASPDVAAALGVTVGEGVVHRLRSQGASNTPYRLAENFYPVELAGGQILEQMQQDEHFDVLEAIKKAHAKSVRKVHEVVVGRLPSGEEQRLLNITRNAPVLEVRRTSSDEDGTAIMYNRLVLVASFFELIYDYNAPHWK